MPRPSAGPRLKLRKQKGARPVYEIVWYESGRRRTKSTRTESLKEAEAALAEYILSRDVRVGLRDPEQRMVLDVLTLYAEEHAPHVNNPERIGYAIDALSDFWAEKTVAEIDENSCAQYCLMRGVASSTLRRELGTLRAAINYDVDKRRLAHTVPVFLPDKPPPRERYLSRNEVAKLLIAARKLPKARHHLLLYILMALYTGARKEALLTLTWPQVDLVAGHINFERPSGKRTKKRRARTPIVSRLLPLLRVAKRRAGSSEYVINFNGGPVDDVKKSFRQACVTAGLKRVTPHTLRHTAITWLLQDDVSVWKVSGYVGATPETIHRVYGHHSPDYLAEAREVLEKGGRARRERRLSRALA